jgi:hypothetical protein
MMGLLLNLLVNILVSGKVVPHACSETLVGDPESIVPGRGGCAEVMTHLAHVATLSETRNCHLLD